MQIKSRTAYIDNKQFTEQMTRSVYYHKQFSFLPETMTNAPPGLPACNSMKRYDTIDHSSIDFCVFCALMASDTYLKGFAVFLINIFCFCATSIQVDKCTVRGCSVGPIHLLFHTLYIIWWKSVNVCAIYDKLNDLWLVIQIIWG